MNQAASSAQRSFGVTQSGATAQLWTLRNQHLACDLTDFGATLVALRCPDRTGAMADVVLGFDAVSGYQSADNQYFGCTTGRVCNRIRAGHFTLDGSQYQLAQNNGPHCLHGGATRSLDKVLWRGVSTDAGRAVQFSYVSPHGEEGFPGELQLTVTYTLLEDGLRIDYRATTDRRTPVNLTNHAYFNLAGAGQGDVLDHQLWIDADSFTPTDATLIPTGSIVSVAGTALDFRTPALIGARLHAVQDQPEHGYDHNFVLRECAGLRPVARLSHGSSGRTLTVLSDAIGLQLYTGNWLHQQIGKQGKSYAPRGGVCLETQHFPDSINQAQFPSIVLEPNSIYATTTIYRLGAR